MASTLANALDFFRDFGVFDVILPFLLIFTVVFAILQKTKLLGEDKPNLDAIVAFVIGLLVVAATKVVTIINEALPQVMVLVVVSLGFLLMLGIFAKPGGTFFDQMGDKFRVGLMVIMSFAVVLIFLGVIENDNGQSWLSYGWNYLLDFWTGAVVGSIILLLVVVAAIYFVVSGSGEKKKDEE
ncbi:MAG: hypothetical protein CMH62_02180 [Nanoarchaeota archaeon]|nr:hypothetical protein [Nanoarchaeota archaeon]|tara:strand:+ start:1953 stop:2501 length:549 start_codon:yes stop_codon:yes gene_type:complete